MKPGRYCDSTFKDLMHCALDRHEFVRGREDELKDVLHPLHFAIKATTGTGKSDLIRQEVASYYIPEAKRLKLPHRVLIAVPTHKLANEARNEDARRRYGRHLARPRRHSP